jgi:catechol 2,3-dioxygenase-like lactoylglutathione lyase family enzyme
VKLGAFSISLAVKDLGVSRAFYEKLGFETTGGGEGYAIMVNGETVIGLFQGMFDKNMLTFNPGWSGPNRPDESFTDVRELKRRLEEAGIELADDNTGASESGPAHVMIIDPDGNPILIDQHV